MTTLELLKSNAEFGWKELSLSLDGVTEGQAWAVLPNLGSDYLHTDGSITGIVLHLACVKWMYGSICFRSSELRWREVADRIEAFEPSWDAALDYLRRGHEYWMESWAELGDIEEVRPTNWKKELPAWRVIQVMNQHDSYHAGQVAMLRYAIGESKVKPASVAEDIRQNCTDSIAW